MSNSRIWLNSGKIFKTQALPEEADEPELAAKPRIIFNYNKKSAGRLNQMILKNQRTWPRRLIRLLILLNTLRVNSFWCLIFSRKFKLSNYFLCSPSFSPI